MRSEFRVLPWDFFALPDAPPPHVEAIQISGAPRRFELLPLGGRVYFRLEDASDARVWATLDDGNTTDFVRTFRRAIGNGRIARVFQTRRSPGHSETLIYVLMSAHGEVQGREWCATRWFDLKPDSPKLTAYLRKNGGIFHPKWRPPFREVLGQLWDGFFDQPMSEADRALTEARWVRGDATTLDKLVAPFLWNYEDLCLRSNGDLLQFSISKRKVMVDEEFLFPSPLFPPNIAALFESHFAVRGVEWWSHDEYPRRGAWEFYIPPHVLSVPAEPSAHERLEALLFLREWLEGKLPSQEISALLA